MHSVYGDGAKKLFAGSISVLANMIFQKSSILSDAKKSPLNQIRLSKPSNNKFSLDIRDLPNFEPVSNDQDG